MSYYFWLGEEAHEHAEAEIARQAHWRWVNEMFEMMFGPPSA